METRTVRRNGLVDIEVDIAGGVGGVVICVVASCELEGNSCQNPRGRGVPPALFHIRVDLPGTAQHAAGLGSVSQAPPTMGMSTRDQAVAARNASRRLPGSHPAGPRPRLTAPPKPFPPPLTIVLAGAVQYPSFIHSLTPVPLRPDSDPAQNLSSEDRAALLYAIADALEANEDAIMRENEKDIAAAEAADTESHLLNRLKMKPGKIAQLAAGAGQIADMEEPLGRQLSKMKVADGLTLEQVRAPPESSSSSSESRPGALRQIRLLAIRSGNGLLLKGGKEATKTNAILHKIIVDCMPAFGVDRKCIVLVEGRAKPSPDILALHDVVDLVIPRGSNSLVSYISNNTKIPVLGHADGVCHMYLDPNADVAMAAKLAVDSKTDYPAAYNALETLLVHKSLIGKGKDGYEAVAAALVAAGCTLHGGARAEKALKLPESPAPRHEYGTWPPPSRSWTT